jgi:hypothetical protein
MVEELVEMGKLLQLEDIMNFLLLAAPVVSFHFGLMM